MSANSAAATLDGAFEAFNHGDPEPLIGAYATQDVVLIGTEKDNWYEQTQAIATALRADGGGEFRLDWNLRPVALDPDAALLVGTLNFVLSNGAIFPTRATYVLRREDSEWRIAHSHISLPSEA